MCRLVNLCKTRRAPNRDRGCGQPGLQEFLPLAHMKQGLASLTAKAWHGDAEDATRDKRKNG